MGEQLPWEHSENLAGAPLHLSSSIFFHKVLQMLQTVSGALRLLQREIINIYALFATVGPIKGCNQDNLSQQEVLGKLFLTVMLPPCAARWGHRRKTTCLKGSKTFTALPVLSQQQRVLCIFTGPSGSTDDSVVSPM